MLDLIMQEQIVKALDSLSFKKITNSESEASDFIDNIKNKDHSILLFQTDSVRDKIVNSFIDKSKNRAYTACFSNDSAKYNCDEKITYNELVENEKLQEVKISEFLVGVLDKAYPSDFPRIACEDTTWFSEVGFFEEHQKLGSKVNQNIINGSAILCCYNTAKLDDEMINTILQSREYAIIEEPFSVYQKQHS